MIDSNIHPLYLPAHTTHLIQPLDNVILAGLKWKMGTQKQLEMIRRLLTHEGMETIIQDIFTDIESEALNPHTIQAGFKNTGIWPFDEKLILDKFKNEYMWMEDSKVETIEAQTIEAIAHVFKEKVVH